MPVTREQAQMLTALAIACRPYRAPTWDEAGVMAAIAKVHDRALPEVALAVIRAAADREAKTPGVIPTEGSHWQEQLKPPLFRPQPYAADRFCHICGQPVEGHRLVDHKPQSAAEYAHQLAEKPLDVHRAVEALKELAHTDPEPRPEPVTSTAGTEHVAPIREALAGGAA